MTADDEEALGRLEQLGGLLDKVAAQLAEVAKSAAETRALAVKVETHSRRTRTLALGLAVSFTLDIVLTVVVTLLSVGALNQGATLHASQLTACAIGNQARTQQITLWNEVLALSAQSPNANQKTDEAFKQFIVKTFAPVNCAEVYKN